MILSGTTIVIAKTAAAQATKPGRDASRRNGRQLLRRPRIRAVRVHTAMIGWEWTRMCCVQWAANQADRDSAMTLIAVGMMDSQDDRRTLRLTAIPATMIMPSSTVILPACRPEVVLSRLITSPRKRPEDLRCLAAAPAQWVSFELADQVDGTASITCCLE
jgi:hypothetical protein